jgi:hypothetical protein
MELGATDCYGSPMRWTVRIASLGLLLQLDACTSDAACLPGAQVECACPSGAPGVQVCSDDGTSLEPCSCEGAGGTGGSGANGGAAAGGEGGASTCAPGAEEACYDGPPSTEGEGTCQAGTRLCDVTGQWGACMGQVLPASDDCQTAADEDCDGAPATCGAGFARSLGGDSSVLAVAVDAQGNVLLGGFFQTFVDFGGGNVLTNVGQQDAFVAKLSPTGEHLWSHAIGSPLGNATLTSPGTLAVDSQGNLYAGVSFVGEVSGLGQTFESEGESDALLLVVGPDGELVRSDVWGSTGVDFLADFELDSADALTLLMATAGPVAVGTLILPGGLGLAKLAPDGAALYARPTVAASGLPRLSHIPGAAEVLVATRFLGTADLGLGEISTIEPDTLLLARFDDVTGEALEQTIYPRTAQQIDGLLVTASGDRLLASSSYEADFGQRDPFTGYTYVARLDPMGTPEFLLATPGRASASTLIGEDLVFGMTVNATLDYEGIPVDFDSLLVRRGADGSFVSADVFDDTSNTGGLTFHALTRAPDGVLVAGGSYLGEGFDFAGHPLPPIANTYAGFVARLAP